MGNCIITNNATGELSAGINDSVTSLVLKTGEGALFPNPTGSEYFYVTISDDAGNIEICKVTTRSTNTLTIVRGQDNTTAQSWDADDTVSLRFNAEQYENFFQLDGDNVAAGDITQTGDLTMVGDLDVTGTGTFSDTLTADGTVDINGNTTLDGTFDVTGVTTVAGNTTVTGDLDVVGAFDVTGAATISTTLGVTTNCTVGGTLGVTGVTTMTSAEMTGILTVNEDVILNSVSTRKYIELHRGDSLRWRLGHDMGTESGSDVASDLELDAVDDAGTTATTVLTISRATQVVDFAEMPTIGSEPVGFASGTKMVFYQANAPTGWTAESINDKALRVVSAAGTGGTDGGTTAFSSVLASRTLSADQIPAHWHAAGSLVADSAGAHTHTYTKYGTTSYGSSGLSGVRKAAQTGTTSSSGSHTHSVSGQTGESGSGNAIDFAVQYSDVIICEKD